MDRPTCFAGRRGAPVVYLHMGADEGAALAERIGDLGWTLVAVNCDWNRDLTPWPAKAVFRGGGDFGGGARAHLERLTESVLPQAEAGLTPAARYLAGYSLAGLFAAWAAARTDAFDGIASVSGSMWYPGFAASVEEARPRAKLAYFSVGDRESLSRNPAFHTLEEDTERVRARFAACGARTVFQRNPGGHFQDPAGRMERAIRWLHAQD